MIRDNVSYYTRLRGLTLGQLANRLNITRQTLHAQTTGPANIVSIERIAAALEVPAWKLLHPDPASIETPPAPSLCCPICGGRLTVRIEPDDRHQETPAPAVLPVIDSRQEKNHDAGNAQDLTIFQ